MSKETNKRTMSLWGVACVLAFSFVKPCLAWDIENVPSYLSGVAGTAPMTMLVMSKDHQLFKKAYDDYSAPGDTGKYRPNYAYYGYFDSTRCYKDKGTYFYPIGKTEKRDGVEQYTCPMNTAWSGNFMNWATMTRIDVIRKMLYGGKRSTDSMVASSEGAPTTILEVTLLPSDSHSFVKYYKNADGQLDLRTLTPLEYTELTFCNTTDINDRIEIKRDWGTSDDYSHSITTPQNPLRPAPVMFFLGGNYQLWSDSKFFQCQRMHDTFFGYGAGAGIANFTELVGSPNYSGDFYLAHNGANFNVVSSSTSLGSAGAYNPPISQGSLFNGGNTTLRVAVCPTTVFADQTDDEKEHCATYRSGSATYSKPVGLLQKYGSNSEFALLTGSYDANFSGGLLRKKMSTFDDELDMGTGVFKSSPTGNGIRASIDALRVYGWAYQYRYDDTKPTEAQIKGYIDCSDKPLWYVRAGGTLISGVEVSMDADVSCASWGNPISEMYLEALRYLAGKGGYNSSFIAAPPAITTTLTSPENQLVKNITRAKDKQLGMLQPESWDDPMSYQADKTRAKFGKLSCRRVNVVVLSSGANSFDGDELTLASEVNALNYVTDTNNIGTWEEGSWLVGRNGAAPEDSEKYNIGGAREYSACQAISVGDTLSNVRGICPDAPDQQGSYAIAGLALHAHTHPIRTSALNESGGAVFATTDSNSFSFKVNTFGVALGQGVPKISVITNSRKIVTISPASIIRNPTYGIHKVTPGSLVDFRLEEKTATGATYRMMWNHSLHGSTYGMDLWGKLTYTVSDDTVTVTTTYGNESSYGTSRNSMLLGYVISGTGTDGSYFPTGYIVAADLCIDAADSTSVHCPTEPTQTFTAIGTEFPKDPLFLAAKYGSFKGDGASHGGTIVGTSSYDYRPITAALSPNQWDQIKLDSSTGADGYPDAYFLATQPALLEASLKKLFTSAKTSKLSNTRSATALSILNTGNYVYEAVYDTELSGSLLAKPVVLSDSGAITYGIPITAKLPNNLLIDGPSAGYPVYTKGTGLLFDWPKINTRDVLYVSGVTTCDGMAVGSTGCSLTREYRNRKGKLIGAMINSSPWFVGAPADGYYDTDYGGGGYATFQQNNKNRKLVFVGANDGLLHAFAGDTMVAKFSYFPSVFIPQLESITGTDFSGSPFVDGSPFSGDVVNSSGAWQTYVIAPLGRGGKGLVGIALTSAAFASGWEFTGTDDVDIGYIVGRPQTNAITGRARQLAAFATASPVTSADKGKWVVVTGNGYNSAGQGAALYLLSVGGATGAGGAWTKGTDYIKLCASTVQLQPDECGTPATPNGLGTPLPLDTNGDGFVDVIYAADLRGQLWKFSHTTGSDWKSGWTTTLIFTAQNNQPITGNIEAIYYPSQQGYMINFATGKYLESSDGSTTAQQTVYGVLDKANTSALTRASLQAQTATRNGSTGYTTLDDKQPIDWSTQKGWYMDFPSSDSNPSERMITGVSYLSPGLNLLVPTLKPITSPTNCDVGVNSYAYLLNPFTGNAPDKTFDLDNTTAPIESVDSTGKTVVGIKLEGLGVGNVFKPSTTPGVSSIQIQGSDTQIKIASPLSRSGRVYWREVPQ